MRDSRTIFQESLISPAVSGKGTKRDGRKKEDSGSRSEWQADLGKNSMVTSSATAYGGRGRKGQKEPHSNAYARSPPLWLVSAASRLTGDSSKWLDGCQSTVNSHIAVPHHCTKASTDHICYTLKKCCLMTHSRSLGRTLSAPPPEHPWRCEKNMFLNPSLMRAESRQYVFHDACE
ncbi:hypothetical protein ABG768_008775 [Culter alburnus]|uniref:Uncharacterized protein n=1 Tax=Culter alburnus TaxID=194366 RepID=A0AAW1ZHR4_CULAL